MEKNLNSIENNVKIVPIQKKYMHDVIEILQSISEFKPNKDEYNSIWLSYNNQKNVHALVALIDDKVVGYGSIFIETKIRGGKIGHIEDVVSRNLFQEKGVGKAILDSLFQIAVNNGCYKVALACKKQNVLFYKKCSYVLHGFNMQRFM